MEFAAARNVVKRTVGGSFNSLGKCFAAKPCEVLRSRAAANAITDGGIKEGNF